MIMRIAHLTFFWICTKWSFLQAPIECYRIIQSCDGRVTLGFYEYAVHGGINVINVPNNWWISVGIKFIHHKIALVEKTQFWSDLHNHSSSHNSVALMSYSRWYPSSEKFSLPPFSDILITSTFPMDQRERGGYLERMIVHSENPI